ncbi:MAG: multidrug effflux MFS transporter [Pseudomonadota bacterium]
MDSPRASVERTFKPLSFPELVAITAAVMALNALAIDMMLPALGIIGDELGAAEDNDRQLVIVVYILGNGIAQLFFGPIVDRFGRRNVILLSLCGYVAASGISVFASSFTLLLVARGLQGMATAAARVAIIASVRDQVAGRRMAEVMSLAITIFMAAPILAPSFGQIVLFTAPWRGIFVVLLLYGLAVGLWAFMRMPETLPRDQRAPLSLKRIFGAYGEFMTHRTAIGYTVVSALCFGALFGFITTSEQVFLDTFEIGELFSIAFAFVAGALACATLVNARLVGRFGMRRLTHGALLVFVVANIIHLAISSVIGETLAMYMVFMGVSFFCLGLIGPNCSAIAMQPMGHIAGAAAAANGFAGTTLAGFLGAVIGRFYDGTTAPVVTGFAVLGIVALMVAILVENGRLFQTHEPV